MLDLRDNSLTREPWWEERLKSRLLCRWGLRPGWVLHAHLNRIVPGHNQEAIAWLIQRLGYQCTKHVNLHVRGYNIKANIDDPLEFVVNNERSFVSGKQPAATASSTIHQSSSRKGGLTQSSRRPFLPF